MSFIATRTLYIAPHRSDAEQRKVLMTRSDVHYAWGNRAPTPLSAIAFGRHAVLISLTRAF